MKALPRIKLFWFYIATLFKKPNMKNLAGAIENCLRTKVLNKCPYIKLEKSIFTLNEQLFQLSCEIIFTNLYNFELIIDFSDINNIKYSIENINIKDISILASVSTDINSKLNQNKDFINGLIRSYFKLNPI